MPLQEGATAPAVSAPNQHGERVAVPVEGPTVLYFYPRDDTPGCTTEAVQFDAELGVYREAGVTVYGVSVDDVDSHREFAEKHDIGFDLLADSDGEIADAYGVETVSAGATRRTTIVILDGEVHAVYEAVDPDGHAREVLQDLLDDAVVELDG